MVMSRLLQTTLQLLALPVFRSVVQAVESSQLPGHGVCEPSSQVSPFSGSTTRSPQAAEQSLSEPGLHPAGQQRSPPTHASTISSEQRELHVSGLPVNTAR